MRLTLLAIAVLLAVPSTAAAETFNVTGTADGVELCAGTSCPSIRAALVAARDSAGPDEIAVPSGDYQLTGGVLLVDSPVTIRGEGARVTAIIAGGDRVFDVSPGVTAELTRLTMRGGTAGFANGFFGGNLRNNGGNVLLDHVRVTEGSGHSGGGVSNAAGTMTIQYSLIDHNQAVDGGGDSGGIQNFGSADTPGVLTVRDSTVAFNTARLGGGIFSWGNAGNVTTVQRVTVARNVGQDRGIGGIGGEPAHVAGSIIAHNTVNGEPSNCGPGTISDGGNVVSNGDCEFTANGDVQDADPLLAPNLTDAGGETDLLTIASDSPARDRAGACDGTDQRDLERPQGAGCDAGAFEIEAVVQVNTDADHPVDKCEPSPGDCTLREAIVDPQLPEKIEVPAGVYELTQGELQITRPVDVVGADARLTRIGPQREGTGRIFFVASGVDATIRAASVVGGDVGINSGGGILAEDGTSLHLIDSAVTGNVAAQGGGISSRGILELERTTVSGNFANVGGAPRGGGIEFLGTQATLTNSTISGNTAESSPVEGRGGGIFTTGNLVLRNVTIAENTAGRSLRGPGGGIFQEFAGTEATIASNTLIASNAGGNCAGTVDHPIQSTNGLSDEFPDPTCRAEGPGNQVVEDALIGPLDDNGGPTDTHALRGQSPAIDKGGEPCPAVDQRGIARPQRQACDVGAYEAEPGAEPVRLDGTPLDIWSDGVGRLQFRFDGEDPGLFYNPFFNAANAGLEIKQGDTHYRLGEGRLILAPPEVTGQTMTSSYMVGPDLLVTEKITYADGSQDVDITYTIQNVSPQTLSFRAGELADLFVGGNDHGTGVFTNTAPRFIGGRSPSGIVSGLIERTPWTHFQESDYVSVFLNFAGDGLTDTFDTNLVDNGVGVEWERTLDPQQTERIDLTWRVAVASTVNTDVDGDDGACTPAPGGCTLREALNYVQPGTAITVPADTYTLVDGPLVLRDGIAIRGAGARATTIVAAGGQRALEVVGQNTGISGVRITGGNSGSNGGGILVMSGASLELVESTVDDNEAHRGGGIYSAGSLTVLRSTISGNRALDVNSGRGGGLYLSGSTASVTSSTFSGNRATNEGGGIFNEHASLELRDVTVTSNTASDGSGGGIAHEEVPGSGDSVTAINTVVAGNVGGACFSVIGNLIDSASQSLADDASCFPASSGNLVANAGLGPLADNGGPTNTHALLAGSAAIDAGSDACQSPDQRGVTRPRGAACDIGAFERIPPPPQESPPPTDTGGGGTVTQPPPPQEEQLPPPEPNETVNLEPKSGTVKVRVKGTKTFVELTEDMQVPLGSELDLRNGRITLTAASDKSGGTATADFYGGTALVRQTKGAKPITRLTLTEKLACPNGQAATAARRKKKRRLWGDGSGRFRTEGEFSSATVRGTKWLTEDSCNSTLTRVARGSVSVRDFVKKKTVVVKAGKQYVAKRGR